MEAKCHKIKKCITIVVGQEIDCSTNMRSNDPKQHCKKIDLQKVIDCLDKMKTEHKDSRVYNLLYMSY